MELKHPPLRKFATAAEIFVQCARSSYQENNSFATNAEEMTEDGFGKMKIILLFASIVLASAQIVVTTTPYFFTIDSPPICEKADLPTVDFSTHEQPAKVWNRLSTNVSSFQLPITMVHAVYPSCKCDSCTGKVWTERSTVILQRVALIEGQEFILKTQTISYSDRNFVPAVSTNKVYLP